METSSSRIFFLRSLQKLFLWWALKVLKAQRCRGEGERFTAGKVIAAPGSLPRSRHASREYGCHEVGFYHLRYKFQVICEQTRARARYVFMLMHLLMLMLMLLVYSVSPVKLVNKCLYLPL